MKHVVFNQKGGVGKTTIVCNLAAVAAARGQRTLVIDLDTQANATRYLLGSEDIEPTRTVADFFESTLSFTLGTDPFERYATETPFENLDVVVASPELDSLQPKLEAKQKVQKLRQALDKMQAYDRVFIDTPPAMNFYSRSALIACDYVLIPFDCDEFARQALYTLLENIAEIREDHNEDLEVEGIVVVLANLGDVLQQRVQGLARELVAVEGDQHVVCLLYTSPSPRDGLLSRMPSSA